MADVTDPRAGTHDLRSFFRAVGRFSGQRALQSAPPERVDADHPVEMLEHLTARVVADPLEVAAWCDGIQASLVVTHREHRPVYLSYVAAGAVADWGRPVAVDERLEVVCSEADEEWVDSVRATIPSRILSVTSPPEVEGAAVAALGAGREAAERRLAEEQITRPGVVAVDGGLVGRPSRAPDRLVGYVKSAQRRYLPDESVLYGLAPGWRSPMFRIPAGAGSAKARYSAYVRLHDASHAGWAHGLIRVETFSKDLIGPAAARALAERQSAASGDGRWDRHLGPIRACEEFLRARRPSVYTLGL